MDIEKLIQAAESCKFRRNCDGCPGKIGNKGCLLNGSMEKALLAAKAHYEALIKAERSRVIAEVREWAKNEHYSTYDEDGVSLDVVDTFDLFKKLDSMEPDKGDKE